MCGFYSAFSIKGSLEPSDRRHTSLVHRGPDSQGEYATDFFYAKHYRLEIIGGETAAQPMLSRSGRLLVVFNGEIYNYQEIAKTQLSDAALAEEGDTRVLVEFLDRYGFDRLDQLNGMFAILVVNLAEKKINLIRDRFGVKPLYYSVQREKIYVSSEIKGLFPNIPAEISTEVVENYLNFGVYPVGRHTFFKKVSQVEPGCRIEFGTEGVSYTPYYDIKEALKRSLAQRPSVEEFESLFEDSIRLRLRSDIPISLHYSGGVDSTALLLKTREIWGVDYPIHAYTKAYRESEIDESQIAATYCKKLGIQHTPVLLLPDEVPALMEKLQWYSDEPFGGLPSIAHYKFNLIQKQQGYTVALEGQGGDEAFGGYKTHAYLAMYDLILNGDSPVLLEQLLKEFKDTKDNVIASAEKLIASGFTAHSDLTDFRPGQKRAMCEFGSWLVSIQLYDTLKNKIPRLLRFEDRSAMAASRELRFPFLDYRVMAAAMSLSHQDKFEGGIPKAPLVKIIRKYFGSDFSAAKRSVVSPQTIWLTGPLRAWTMENLKELKRKQVINPIHLERAQQELSQENLGNSFFLWQMININQMFKNAACHYW